ncbi:hypothetical protein ACFXMT_51425 [Streptomyces mirabilis]|uniref:hypothetical protein n=1 Tax=Streptomyces mirabilis TaxID=68239 RepID=UPI003693D477
MTRTSRTQRLVMLAASTALAAGGALIPSSAFAAPATPHTGPVAAVTASHQGHQAAEITGLEQEFRRRRDQGGRQDDQECQVHQNRWKQRQQQ